MLDVHPLHEKIHGFRDFLLHLLTITIGLLIALGLEGCVEWNHHRNLRNEAEANLRQEIAANQKDLAEDRSAIVEGHKQLKEITSVLEMRRDGKQVGHKSLSLNATIATLHDVSWQTAANTGALSYMEYAKVQRYAEAYQMQKQFADLQNNFVEKMPDMLSLVMTLAQDPVKISSNDAAAALPDVRKAMSYLDAMRQIGGALDETYTRTLKAE